MQLVWIKRGISAVLIGSLCTHALAGQDSDQSPQPPETQSGNPCAKHGSQIVGAVVGAVFGLLLGKQVGKGNGQKAAMAIGALGGLAAGNYIGSEMDRRKCELSKIAAKNKLKMVVADLNAPVEQDADSEDSPGRRRGQRMGMSVAIEDIASSENVSDVSGGESIGNAASSTQFQRGSASLSQEAEIYFREIVAQYALPFRPDAIAQGASQEQINEVQGLQRKRLLIVGHTDDTGNSRLNADLSEQRARNVARLFSDAGVPVSQVYYQGSGETQPVADNRSETGRARNRRVEIVDLTDESAFQKYLAARTTNANFYRIAPTAVAPAAAPQAVAPDEPKIARNAAPKIRPGARRNAGPGALTSNSHGDPGKFDFGGRAVGSEPVIIDIGPLVTSRGKFNFISLAHADDLPMARSCSDDRPRVAHAVKSLENGLEYHVSEYLPNLYDTSWVDRVNGNLVALTHVAVLRDGAAPAKRPTLLIYKSSRGQLASSAKADYSALAQVNTYQGETGLLYRVFSDGPIKCMDVVIPREHPNQATNSALYYEADSTRMVATFNPTIAK